MSLRDKISQGFDKAVRATESAVDAGKLRVNAYQARQRADKKAEELGYLVGRAKAEGREPDSTGLAMLVDLFSTADREAVALEAQAKGEPNAG